MGSDQGKRESGLGSDLASGIVDLIVQAAKVRHEMNLGVDALKAWRESRGVSGEPLRLANLSFDLAEFGVRGWRDLMAVQRRYEPEMMAAWTVPGAPWLDPSAELRAGPALLDFEVKRQRGKQILDAAEGRPVVLENRSHGYVDLVLPRTMELVRADELDRLVVQVSFTPAAPILGPGDEQTVTVVLETVDRTIQWTEHTQDQMYYGTLCVGSRGGMQVGIPVALKVTK